MGTADVLEAAAVRMDASTSVVSLGELLLALVACPARHESLDAGRCTDKKHASCLYGRVAGTLANPTEVKTTSNVLTGKMRACYSMYKEQSRECHCQTAPALRTACTHPHCFPARPSIVSLSVPLLAPTSMLPSSASGSVEAFWG